MDEILYINLLKTIALVAGIAGILLGLDLIFGAPITTVLRRVLDKYFNFDKIITSSKAKKTLGVIFLILSLIMLLLIRGI